MLWPEPVFQCAAGRQPAVFLGCYVGQELQHRVLLQPGEVVSLWRGSPAQAKCSWMTGDSRREKHCSSSIIRQGKGSGSCRTSSTKARMFSGSWAMRVEHLAVFVRGQLPV